MTGFGQVILENYSEKYNSQEKIVLVNSTKRLNLSKKGKIFQLSDEVGKFCQFFWVQSLFGLTDVHFAGS